MQPDRSEVVLDYWVWQEVVSINRGIDWMPSTNDMYFQQSSALMATVFNTMYKLVVLDISW